MPICDLSDCPAGTAFLQRYGSGTEVNVPEADLTGTYRLPYLFPETYTRKPASGATEGPFGFAGRSKSPVRVHTFRLMPASGTLVRPARLVLDPLSFIFKRLLVPIFWSISAIFLGGFWSLRLVGVIDFLAVNLAHIWGQNKCTTPGHLRKKLPYNMSIETRAGLLLYGKQIKYLPSHLVLAGSIN